MIFPLRFCSSFVEALKDLRAHAYYRLINPNWYLFESEIFGSVPYLALTKKIKNLYKNKLLKKQKFKKVL